MAPEYGLAVMSFDNVTYGGTSTLNIAMLDGIIATAGLEPRWLPPSLILETRKSQLVELLPDWKDAEESGVFADNFFMDNRLGDLVENTRQLYEEAGEIQGIGPMRAANQLRGSFVVEGDLRDIEVFFTLSPEPIPLIQQVRMRAVRP